MSKIILVAHNIRSAHNVGSLFRTCDGFGAELILSGITPRPMSANDDRLPHIAKRAQKEIEKTALGAEKSVPYEYFPDFNRVNEYLKKNNYKLYAIEQHETSINIHQLKNDGKIAIIVGPEVTGIDAEIISECDSVYEIPMKGNKESFNVSIAAAIALYQLSL